MYLDVSPCAVLDRPPTLSRIAVLQVEVGDVLLVAGQPRRVCGVAAAIDRTKDFRFSDGGTWNAHPYVRVSVVG